MFFSIIIPIYNVKRYLEKCLDSIKNQTYKDFEAIMVDDGSTDGCYNICEKYAENDDRFIVVHKKNQGLVSARKTGANLASGEYIINVDSDDFVEYDFLNKIHEAIISSPVDIVAFNYKVVNEDGEFIRNEYNQAKSGIYNDKKYKSIKYKFLYDNSKFGQNSGCLIFSIWSKAVKRELYTACQLLVDNNITKGEDVVLCLLLLVRAKSILICDITDYNYRIRSSSMMNKCSEKDIFKQEILVNELLKISKRYFLMEKQIRMYIFYSSFMILKNLISKKVSYGRYLKYIRIFEKTDIFKTLKFDLCKNVSIKEIFKVTFVKTKCWPLLFVYLKLPLYLYKNV